MLIGLTIRDVVLVEALNLAVGSGLTVLTGETGAGKSIILDALGLATGARADAGLVRAGAERATATAVFAPPPGHPVWAYLEDKGLGLDPTEDLVLRRQLGADGRSRAFVNDQRSASACSRTWANTWSRCTASTRPWACSTPAPIEACSTTLAGCTTGRRRFALPGRLGAPPWPPPKTSGIAPPAPRPRPRT